MTKTINLLLLMFFLIVGRILGQTDQETIPKIIEKDGRHALLVDGSPFLILGGQAHNSSAWPG
ncbi:MAG TPA: hypothetical protein VII44_12130, partial [Puia sp.]